MRAELASHETSPQATSLILGFIETELLPVAEKVGGPRISVARDADTYARYPWVQPGEPETVKRRRACWARRRFWAAQRAG